MSGTAAPRTGEAHRLDTRISDQGLADLAARNEQQREGAIRQLTEEARLAANRANQVTWL